MQILSITLKNIKSHQDTELHFVQGINVLAGVNGVGKSTIFEAVGYALFGVDARDFVGNIDRFISIGAKKGEIAVTFAVDSGETYRVSRTVGAGSKWLLAKEIGAEFEVEDHAGAQETEARIKELLGLTGNRALADQYKLVIGPFQHEFLGPFVLKQSTKRQEAFDEILGIDAWRKTYNGTRTLLAAIKGKIEILNVEIEGRQEQVAALPEREKEQAELVREIEACSKELAGKEKLLVEAEKQLIEMDAQEKMLDASKAEMKRLEDRIAVGREKIADQQKRIKESEQAVAVQAKNASGKKAFEKAEGALKSLRDQDKKRRKIEQELTALEREASRLAQTIEHETREREQTAKQLAAEEIALKKELHSLAVDAALQDAAAELPGLRKEEERLRSAKGLLEGKRSGLQEGKEKLGEGVCPFWKEPCKNIAGKAPRDVFSVRFAALDDESRALDGKLQSLARDIQAAESAGKQIDATRVKAKEVEKQLTALSEKQRENEKRERAIAAITLQRAEAEKKVVSRKADLEQFNNLDDEIGKVERQKEQNQQARDIFFAHEKDARDLQNRQAELLKMQSLFDELNSNLALKVKELNGLEKGYDQKRHAEVRAGKELLVAEVAALKQKGAGFGKDQQRLTEEISKLKRLAEEIKEKSVLKKNFEAKEALVKFLRNKIFNNVSAQLSERFREEISLRADRIYRNIAETDEELFWGDKYRIILRDMQDGQVRERTDDQLSGGQTMSAVVALRLALLQTIGARVAFFDEPTSNLDAARRENLAQAFRAIDVGREEVTEHWYDQLFLISHDVAFTEVTDQVIHLE